MVVISTNRTGLIDVSQGNDSIIVKANSHKEIYNSLNSLLQNPSLVKKIGINAIKTAKNYNWSKYRARLNKIIKDV
jgi:glycosyltransferase involved in cell wall biosynthesis